MTAIAIFVKTPGFSPIKTRLAKDVGREEAERVFLSSAGIVERTAQTAAAECSAMICFWAVAESAALTSPLWKTFPTMPQGEGNLGTRLHNVYFALQAKFRRAILIGADAPTLSSELLHAAHKTLQSADPQFVFGPAQDGGFYLFGGNVPIPKWIWEDTPYSSSSTMSELAAHLKTLGCCSSLPVLSDIDTVEDLQRIRASGICL